MFVIITLLEILRIKIKREEIFFIMEQNEKRMVYRSAWRSFYGLFSLMLLVLILACACTIWGPFNEGAKLKWVWIIAIVVDIFIFLCIALKRMTMRLILKDDPDRPEHQEVEYILCNPLKLFTEFKVSKEVGLAKIADIDVKQNFMQAILDLGDIAISSPGTSEKEINAKNIPNPKEVRDEIQKHARKYTMKSHSSPAPAAAAELPKE